MMTRREIQINRHVSIRNVKILYTLEFKVFGPLMESDVLLTPFVSIRSMHSQHMS